jgi:hypothetical protein
MREGYGRTALAHQLLGNAQAAVGAHDGQRRDVAVLHAVGRLLLHLGEHIAHDLRVVVGGLGRARDIDGDEGQLRPGERVVEVVLEKVVLGQVLEVGVLDQRYVRGAEEPDIHGV